MIKRAWFQVFAATVLVVGGVAVFASQDSIEYKNKKRGFSLRVPGAWEIKERSGGREVTAAAPLERGSKDQFRPQVTVTVEDVLHDMTLAKYVPGRMEKTRNQMKDFKIHRMGHQVVSQARAKWWNISSRAGAADVKGFLLIVVKDDKAFTITCVAVPAQYSLYQETFQNIVRSLVIE